MLFLWCCLVAVGSWSLTKPDVLSKGRETRLLPRDHSRKETRLESKHYLVLSVELMRKVIFLLSCAEKTNTTNTTPNSCLQGGSFLAIGCASCWMVLSAHLRLASSASHQAVKLAAAVPQSRQCCLSAPLQFYSCASHFPLLLSLNCNSRKTRTIFPGEHFGIGVTC